jgi:hypothetical protein
MYVPMGMLNLYENSPSLTFTSHQPSETSTRADKISPTKSLRQDPISMPQPQIIVHPMLFVHICIYIYIHNKCVRMYDYISL